MASFQVRGAIQGTCYTVRAAGFVVSTALVGFGLDGPVRLLLAYLVCKVSVFFLKDENFGELRLGCDGCARA